MRIIQKKIEEGKETGQEVKNKWRGLKWSRTVSGERNGGYRKGMKVKENKLRWCKLSKLEIIVMGMDGVNENCREITSVNYKWRGR